MNDYAVVLQKGNLVIKASVFGGVENIEFTKDGKVSQFIYQGIRYIAIYVFSTKEFIDYAEEIKFNLLIANEKRLKGINYRGVSIDLWANKKNQALDITFSKYNELVEFEAEEDDVIYGVLRDETGLCYNYYSWLYKKPYVRPLGPSKINNPGRPIPYPCEPLMGNVSAQNFYDTYKDKKLYDSVNNTSETDVRLVGEIASLIKTVDTQMFEAFNEFLFAGEDAGEFKFFDNSTNSFTRDELVYYRNGLQRWIQIYEKYKIEFSKLKDAEWLYIRCDFLYRYGMLSLLSVDQKISILSTFA